MLGSWEYPHQCMLCDLMTGQEGAVHMQGIVFLLWASIVIASLFLLALFTLKYAAVSLSCKLMLLLP